MLVYEVSVRKNVKDRSIVYLWRTGGHVCSKPFFESKKNLFFFNSEPIQTRHMQQKDRQPPHLYNLTGHQATKNTFADSLLNQASSIPPPEQPVGMLNTMFNTTAPAMAKKRSRGSICNHSTAVKEAALRSGRAKMTVRRVIRDDKSYTAFLAFCKKEWCGENPAFLRAVQGYKDMKSFEERLKESSKIVDEFFSDKCKHAVSLPAAKLKRLMERSENEELCGNGTLFDEANKMIEHELSLDVFRRFLDSKLYNDIYRRPSLRNISERATKKASSKGEHDHLSVSRSVDSRSFTNRIMREKICPSRCEASMKGWLEKRGGPYSFTGWKRRWFVLRPNFLFYFTPQQSMSSTRIRPQGQIAIREIIGLLKTRTSNGIPCFAVKTANRRYDLKASSVSDRDSWYKMIGKVWRSSKSGRSSFHRAITA